MSETPAEIVDAEIVDAEVVDAEVVEVDTIKLPVKIPQVSYTLRSFSGQTGKKINDSPYRNEVVRMLLDGTTYPEIVENLQTHFNFKVAVLTLAAFKKNFFHYYQESVDRWDKQRYQYVVARITEEMKEAARHMIHEVYEVQHLLTIVDERMDLIRDDKEGRTASFEGVLKDLIKTKGNLLERMSKITGSSGMEQRLKDMVKHTALAAQKTLVPYLRDDKKNDAFILFDQEIEDILMAIDADMAITTKVR